MSDRLKRVLFIIGFVLFAAVVALVLWFVFFRAATAPLTNTTPGGSQGGLQG